MKIKRIPARRYYTISKKVMTNYNQKLKVNISQQLQSLEIAPDTYRIYIALALSCLILPLHTPRCSPGNFPCCLGQNLTRFGFRIHGTDLDCAMHQVRRATTIKRSQDRTTSTTIESNFPTWYGKRLLSEPLLVSFSRENFSPIQLKGIEVSGVKY